MSESSESQSPDPDAHTTEPAGPVEQGPGCLPGIVAATLLMGIVGFITCGVSTWILYGKRTEMAVATLEGSFIPAVEQSRLEPAEKRAVVEQLDQFVLEMKREQYEDWQAAGVLQRLSELPVLQWGELNAVEQHIRNLSDDRERESPFADPSAREAALRDLSRLRKAVEMGKVSRFEIEDVLQPVLVRDESTLGRSLAEPLRSDAVEKVVSNAERIADREGVPEKRFDDVKLEAILRRQIEAGIGQGTQ